MTSFQFSFGGDSSSSGSSSGSSGFSFGGSTGAAAGGSTGGFSFGGTDAGSSTASAPAASSTGGSLFSFGGSAAPAAGGATSGSTPSFGFDLSSSSSSSAAPAAAAPASSAPAAGGFSLDFKLPGTGTATEEKKDGKEAKGSDLGFSFSLPGASSSSSSTSSTAPAASTSTDAGAGAGGFSFSFDGKSSTPAASSSTAAAPAATTGFSFGDTTAAASTTAASTTATSGTDTTAAFDGAARIRNKTVEEILALWNRDLEEHVAAFTEQALEIRKWDRQLIENSNKIQNLQRLVNQAQGKQGELGTTLSGIKNNQAELAAMIDKLEKQIAEQSKSAAGTSDERKREEAYRLAEEVDIQLQQMSLTLTDTVKKLNQPAEKAADSSNPLAQIVRVLNLQMTSLQWVEEATGELEVQLRKAQDVLSAGQAGLSATAASGLLGPAHATPGRALTYY